MMMASQAKVECLSCISDCTDSEKAEDEMRPGAYWGNKRLSIWYNCSGAILLKLPYLWRFSNSAGFEHTMCYFSTTAETSVSVICIPMQPR